VSRQAKDDSERQIGDRDRGGGGGQHILPYSCSGAVTAPFFVPRREKILTLIVRCTIIYAFIVRRTINRRKGVRIMSRVIKRYVNRRLYDVQEKRTVTLQDVAELVKKGEDVMVIDNKTKEDITLPTLFQILSAEAKDWKDNMPSAKVASQFFLKGGSAVVEAVKKALIASIGALDVTREKIEELVDDLIKKGHLDKKDRSQTIRELLERAEERSKEAKLWVEEQVKTTVKRLRPAREEEVDDLRQQVKTLQKTIAHLEKKLTTSGRKPSRR
jgi:polyhydroxyalkanoate synthesis repressor PhaR